MRDGAPVVNRPNVQVMLEAMVSALQGNKADAILREVYNLEIRPYIPDDLEVQFSTYRVVTSGAVGLKLEVGIDGRSSISVQEMNIDATDEPSTVIDKLRHSARYLAQSFDNNQARSRLLAEAIEIARAKDKAAAEAGAAIAELERLL